MYRLLGYCARGQGREEKEKKEEEKKLKCVERLCGEGAERTVSR